MLASGPAAYDQHTSCLSCGPSCKRQRKSRQPKSLFQNLRLKLLSIWSKVEPNRRRDSSTAVSPVTTPNHQYLASSPMVSTPLPKSIDFTTFESPYSEVVECHGFVPLAGERYKNPSYKELAQAIAPRPSLSDDYAAACVNGALYCTIYHSEFENCPDDDEDEGYFERTFRRMEVGDRRCFSFEIQSNVMDHAYFFSEFSKRERVEKMGKADPVNHTEIWEAERIVRHVRKPKQGRTLFLVEWAGRQPNGRPWPKTWEPAENLGPVLLNLYEQETGLKFSRDD